MHGTHKKDISSILCLYASILIKQPIIAIIILMTKNRKGGCFMSKLYNTQKEIASNLKASLILNLSSHLKKDGNLVIKTMFLNN